MCDLCGMRAAVDAAVSAAEDVPLVCGWPECGGRVVARVSMSGDRAELVCAGHLYVMGIVAGVASVTARAVEDGRLPAEVQERLAERAVDVCLRDFEEVV